MALRRRLAHHTYQRSQDVWPIKPAAMRAPAGWPGWPEGKGFAFVLTHDVEATRGLQRCEKLAAIEMESGFRSSFNFIPEGEYRVPASLRENLRREGFEVGVHDLKHDGKLYRSEKHFRSHAAKINQYLAEWKACGFRSGFMHHNLDWIHHLKVNYDLSTFDTDPFEPQPDGVDTIFPFWVPAPLSPKSEHSRPEEISPGYMELPYTLAQDSTLFLLLREKTIAQWTRKIDWIARNGGLALVNVHPDYLTFDGSSDSKQVSAIYFRNLLDYIREKYEGQYWAALPHEVAAYCREFRPSARLSHRNESA